MVRVGCGVALLPAVSCSPGSRPTCSNQEVRSTRKTTSTVETTRAWLSKETTRRRRWWWAEARRLFCSSLSRWRSSALNGTLWKQRRQRHLVERRRHRNSGEEQNLSIANKQWLVVLSTSITWKHPAWALKQHSEVWWWVNKPQVLFGHFQENQSYFFSVR